MKSFIVHLIVRSSCLLLTFSFHSQLSFSGQNIVYKLYTFCFNFNKILSCLRNKQAGSKRSSDAVSDATVRIAGRTIMDGFRGGALGACISYFGPNLTLFNVKFSVLEGPRKLFQQGDPLFFGNSWIRS